MKVRHDTRVDIMKVFLEENNGNEDLTVRGIARMLKLPPSQVFYHMKKMFEKGVFKKEIEGDQVYYVPQQLFFEKVEETKHALKQLSQLIEDANEARTASCLDLFLRCYKVF